MNHEARTAYSIETLNGVLQGKSPEYITGVHTFLSRSDVLFDGESTARRSSCDPETTADLLSDEYWPSASFQALLSSDCLTPDKLRLAGEHPTAEDDQGNNFLHQLAMAITDGSDSFPTTTAAGLMKIFRQAEALIQVGVKPDSKNKEGNTPLMAFAANLSEGKDYKTVIEILELIIKKGASVNARNRCGKTALYFAMRFGRKRAVQTLLEHGANVHARDSNGRSLLNAVDLIISESADPTEYAHFEACRALLTRSGAVQEPSILEEWGETKLSIAKRSLGNAGSPVLMPEPPLHMFIQDNGEYGQHQRENSQKRRKSDDRPVPTRPTPDIMALSPVFRQPPQALLSLRAATTHDRFHNQHGFFFGSSPPQAIPGMRSRHVAPPRSIPFGEPYHLDDVRRPDKELHHGYDSSTMNSGYGSIGMSHHDDRPSLKRRDTLSINGGNEGYASSPATGKCV
jgi:hypothetical protein